MEKWAPYPYQVPRGYGYCWGTAACVPQAYPFLSKKKFSGMGQIRVGSGPIRVGYRRGPKPALFPLDFFFSLTRFSLSFKQSHSILSLTSSLYRRWAMEGASIVDLRRRKVLRLWTCGEEGAPILISLLNMKIWGQKKERDKLLYF